MKKKLATLLVMAILMTSATAFAQPMTPVDNDMKDVAEILEDVDALVENVDTHESKLKRNLDFDRAIDVLQYILRRIELKAQFVQNSREIWSLSKEIDGNLKRIVQEMEDIVKSDREFTADQYYEVKQLRKEIQQNIREADYRIGSIAKETITFAKEVRNKEFIKAQNTFNNILILQKQQIEFLEMILENTQNLLILLQSVA